MSTPIVPYSDATALLGQVHSTLQNRDAVHVACIQVELAECYKIETPAQMLRMNKDGKFVPTTNREQALGILDPFITNFYDLSDGNKVWLILFPGMIRSLSHYWEHEAFPPAPVEQSFTDFVLKQKTEKEASIPENKLSSYQYLSRIAEHLEMSLDRLLAEAHEKVLDNNHYYTGNAEAEGYSVGSDFWFHYENYTETQVPDSHKENFISCMC